MTNILNRQHPFSINLNLFSRWAICGVLLAVFIDDAVAQRVAVMVRESPSSFHDPEYLTDVDGTLYFKAHENEKYGLWKSDGTEAGTTVVTESVIPTDLGVAFNGKLLFQGYDTLNLYGRELWTSDGTEEGTTLHKDICPGNYSSMPSYPDFPIINNTVFFDANDCTPRTYQLWKSDGTESGTVKVTNEHRGFLGGGEMITVNGVLFFAGSNGDYVDPEQGWIAPLHGRELWKSDGTQAGTVMVKDIFEGSGSSYPEHFNNVNGTLYFTARDAMDHGRELWKSDGTEAGTVMVKDINITTTSNTWAYEYNFASVGDILYFLANDGIHGDELWKSDGTEAGTVMVKDIYPGEYGSGPEELVNVNGTLFFVAYDGTESGLWKSDGTAAGTVRVADWVKDPDWLFNFEDTLYFSADDGVHGVELWKSDGTDAGTVMISDIQVGAGSSLPWYFTISDGELFFSARKNLRRQLWKLGYEEEDVSIAEHGQMHISIFPNPTTGHLTIDLGIASPDAVIELYDMQGRLLSTRSASGQQVLQMELDGPAGVYLLRVVDGKGTVNRRIIKQ